jgi:hypothetical protein
MGMQARNKKLFVAVEATPGTPETLVATDAVRTSGLQITRYAGERVSQEHDRAGLGNFRQINVNQHIGLGFSVPFIGSGDAAEAPAWAALLQACAVAETDDTVANDEWYYTPVDDGFKTVTCIVTEELIQQQSAGVRGNFGIEANPGALPVFTFSNWLGSYSRPIALALTAPDDSAYQEAVPVTFSNTSVLTVDGNSFPVSGFTFDAGVTVTRTNQPNRMESVVEDRQPSGTIILSPATANAIIALIADVESHAGTTDVPIVLTHGSGAGNILTLNIYAANFGEISDQVVAGETYFSLPFSVMPDASGDEWRLTQS